jgi:Ca2+-binding RTX toxin-like protein
MSKNQEPNKYKVELLETRLLMDGNQWNDEIHTADYSVVDSQNLYEQWTSTDVESVQLLNPTDDSKEYVSVDDFLDGDNILQSGLNEVVSKVGLAHSLVKNAQHLGQNDVVAASDIQVQLARILTTKDGWTFSTSENAGVLTVSATFSKDYAVPEDKFIVADLKKFAGVDINLIPLDSDNVLHISGSFTCEFNGIGAVDFSSAPQLQAEMKFKQAILGQINADILNDDYGIEDTSRAYTAKGNALGFESVADAPNDDVSDYSAIVKMNLAGQGTVGMEHTGDLNFTVDTNLGENQFTDFIKDQHGNDIFANRSIKLQYNQQSCKWEWNDADIANLENFDMSLVLRKLSDLSQWLELNSTVTADNPTPLLFDSFSGILNQNVSENAKLPKLIDEIMNDSPQSLLNLFALTNSQVAMTYDTAEKKLKIPFELSLPDQENVVSIATKQLEDLGFTVNENKSLKLETTNISLSFSLVVDLDNLSSKVGVDTEIGAFLQESAYENTFGTTCVIADSALPYQFPTGNSSVITTDSEQGIYLETLTNKPEQSKAASDAYIIINGTTIQSIANETVIQLVLKNENGEQTFKVHANASMEDVASALQAELSTNEKFTDNTSARVRYVGDYLVISNLAENFYVKSLKIGSSNQTVNGSGDNPVWVNISEKMPIHIPSDVKIKISFNGTDFEEIEPNFDGAKNEDDVVRIINTFIANNSSLNGCVVAELRDGRIAFRTTGDKRTSSLIIKGTNLNDLGFDVTQTEHVGNSHCMKITVVDSNDDEWTAFVSFSSLWSEQDIENVSVNSLMNIVCNSVFTKADGSATAGDVIQLNDLKIEGKNGFSIKSIENCNGFTFASQLGIVGAEEALFEINAWTFAALDTVQYEGLGLSLSQTLSGKADIDATLGLIGSNFKNDAVNLVHNISFQLDSATQPGSEILKLPDYRIYAAEGLIRQKTENFNEIFISVNKLYNACNTKGISISTLDDLSALVKSIEDFFTSMADLKDYVDNLWKYLSKEYPSSITSTETLAYDSFFVDFNSMLDLFENFDYDSVQKFLQNPKGENLFSNVSSFLTSLDSILKEINYLDLSSICSSIDNTISTLVQSLKSEYEQSVSVVISKSNGNILNLGDTDALALGSISLNDVASSTTSAASSVWNKVNASREALSKWSDVDCHTALKALGEEFGEKFLGRPKDGMTETSFEGIISEEMLKLKIPFMDRTLLELSGLDSKLYELYNLMEKTDVSTLQKFVETLAARTGIGCAVSLQEIDSSYSILLDFGWHYTVKDKKIALGNLGGENTIIGGGIDVTLNGHLDFSLQAKIVYVEGALSIEFDNTQPLIDAEFSIAQNPLSGKLNIHLGELEVPSLAEITQGSFIETTVACGFSFGTESLFECTSATLDVSGMVNLSLFGENAGNIILGMGQGIIDLTELDSISSLVPTIILMNETAEGAAQKRTSSNLYVDLSGLEVSLSLSSLLDKLSVVGDGLSQLLRKAISGLNSELFRNSIRNIPFIGDRIVAAADCLTCLEDGFIEPFRRFIDKSRNLDERSVAEKIYDLLKNANLLIDGPMKLNSLGNGVSENWAGVKFTNSYEGIQFCREGNDEVCWRLRLGGTYELDKSADFDLGFPGLGLRSEGGLSIELNWMLDVGFGVSKTNGAYILLSNGAEFWNGNSFTMATEDKKNEYQDGVESDLNHAGDDLKVWVKVKKNNQDLRINGSLGFLEMSATATDDAFGGMSAYLGIDLNDAKNDKSEKALKDSEGDKEKLSKIGVYGLASNLSVEAGLIANVKIDNLLLELGLGSSTFPKLSTNLNLDWTASIGDENSGLKLLSLDAPTFYAGSFISNTIKPVLSNIQGILKPIQPLIDFLQSEIPVLNKLPAGKIRITVLDLVKMYGSKNDMDFGFLDDIISLNRIVGLLNNGNVGDLELTLPDLVLYDGVNNYTEDEEAYRNNANEAGMNFLNGFSTDLEDYLAKLRETFGLSGYDSGFKWEDYQVQFNAVMNKFENLDLSSSSSTGASSSAISSFSGGKGFAFPVLENPLVEIAGLFLGRDSTLVTYDMSPLRFDFDWKNSYPIVGPLCADIGFNFGVCIDLAFGYDTFGMRRWREGGYKNMSALLDGFYVADWDDSNKDVAEVVFHSGVVAGASIAGRAGVNVGLNLDVNLDFKDPNNDGKVRLGELAKMLDENALMIFDASASVQAKAFAYLDYFFGTKKWTLWSSDAFELFDTASKSSDQEPVLVSDNGDYLVVNVGDFAAGRNSGNLSDGDDVVTIEFTGAKKFKVSWGNYSSEEISLDKDPSNPKKGICVYAGKGNDAITIKSAEGVSVSADVIVYGGDGDDLIDATGLTLAANGNAILIGNNGVDVIKGAAGTGNNFIFGETARFVRDDDKVKLAEAYPDVASAETNVLFGGAGKNFIFGGAGSDILYAGDFAETTNYLFGDGGRIEYHEDNLLEVSRYDLFDEGGDDLIYGSVNDDKLYGGAGTDWIEGLEGDDEIYGGQGNDILIGGNGTDKIYGYDGADVIFGDTPVNPNMVIADTGDTVGILPYDYLSSDYYDSKSSHPLFSSAGLVLTTPQQHFVNLPFEKIKSIVYSGEQINVNKLTVLSKILGLNEDELKTNDSYDRTKIDAAILSKLSKIQDDGGSSNSTDYIYGGNGSDIIFGDDGADGASASGGNDVIEGGADNDFVDGDAGDDRITGGSGEDIIYGGQGNDTLDGGAGNDIVFGDDGWADINGSNESASSLFGVNNVDNLVFGYTLAGFVDNFGILPDATSISSGGKDFIYAGNGSDVVDGQGSDDVVLVNFMGEFYQAYTNVFDSGSTFGDELAIEGTIANDDVLIRASDAGLGLVALLPVEGSDKSKLERVNFWKTEGRDEGVDIVSVDTGAGADRITLDGTLSAIAIDSGAGDDEIFVGQQFDTERSAAGANVQVEDQFSTEATMGGHLSAGVKHATSITAGSGDDTVTVLHTSAPLALSGKSGDDTFNIHLFVDDDNNPIMNGPVTVIGGTGEDLLNVVGSEGDDTFVYTSEGVSASGVSIQSISIESDHIYGGKGDDSFYLLSSRENQHVYMEGGDGNDSFYNGGVQTDEHYIQVENRDYRGHNGIIEHTVSSTSSAYASGPADSIGVNIIDNDSCPVEVLFTDAMGHITEPRLTLAEGGAYAEYYVRLSRALAQGETVTVTVFAPTVTRNDRLRGDAGVVFVNESGAEIGNSVTFTFTAGMGLGSNAHVRVKAKSDSLREGDDHAALLHKVEYSGADTFEVGPVRNVLAFVDDRTISVDTTRPFVVVDEFGVGTRSSSIELDNDSSVRLAYELANDTSVFNLTVENQVFTIHSEASRLNGEKYCYRAFGNQLVICCVDGDNVTPQSVSGILSAADGLTFATVADDANGLSTADDSLPGTVKIRHNDSSTDVAEGYTGSPTELYTDYYTITLNGTALAEDETVTVSIRPALTPYAKGGEKIQQVEVYKILDGNGVAYTNLTQVVFDSSCFDALGNCRVYRVYVRAIDDSVTETDDLTLVPVGRNTIEHIHGTTHEDGGGSNGPELPETKSMIRYSNDPQGTSNDEQDPPVQSEGAEEEPFDETRSVDRVFVNNMDYNPDATSALHGLGETPVAGRSQSDSALLESDAESLRFTHSAIHATGMNLGNMEYGEFNLGNGVDTVDVSRSLYRDPGVDGENDFQEFTVINSGRGGDVITVNSYQDGEDDQLVINAGEGNDTVAATGANVTKDGLIVFGGLGDDSIDIDSDSSFVFGDRGQVLYHDDDGNVVTRLGDDGSGVTVKGEGNTYTPSENGSDYATGKNKDSEAYWQTDGVRRGPSIARTVTENQGGNDVITLADGRNVVFGGVNATRTVPADTSKHENENEVISTGNGNDLVFGDDGYATFGGHAALAETLELDNAPETRTEATLSFNFMGASQTGLSSEDVAGAADFAKSHWNNVGGSLAGTYGNDDRETVRFDDGTRASAVSVSYGGIESHRNTSTDNRINLQAYGHNFANASTDADAALMNSGYMTTAPGNQCDNRLEVAVDGLAQYFTDYHVAVYLDMPDANSWEGQSIRKVSLYVGNSTVALQSFYVNDCAGSNFNGTYRRSEYTSAEDILADLAHNAAVLSGELTGEDAVLIDTTGNYVVFEVPAGVAADSFRVIIEDGYTLDNINGKDIPGIAAIQVKGTLHAQDVAASTDIAHGGADTVYTSGGDDIVVGGTGGDTLTTYGDERYGIYDNDVVFGDNAKMVFTDRDSSEATVSTLSLAESLDSRTVAGDYNDHIYTGDGNDVVVGGQGADHIESGATAAAETMLDGIQVASFNFTRENATASEMVGETAGVVADNDWTNLYIKNNGLHVVGENYTNDPVTHDGIGISLVAYDTAVGDGTQNSSLMPKDDAQLDGDTSNSKLFNAYYAAQQQQEIKLTLTNLDSFADGAPCDVYVYLGGDQQNTDTYNYLFDVWGHQSGVNTPDQHYYLNDWTGSHFDGDYRLVECATAPTAAELLSQVAPDMSLIGNYVVFHGVSSATFEVRIRNLFTDTNQWPLNLPVITAVQVVAGENREEDIAVGGDHDKDLVFGDDARVTFDIDAPFARNENLADYANRAIEAESIHYDGAAVEIPLDENDEPVEMGDTILTGKDRDVIVGGDFGDTITMGDGDDVALGDNASIILEHNNPVGVFAPSVEIMLEQHTVTTSTPEVFLGNNDTDAGDIQDKFENGGVPGVTPETSANGDTDFYADVTNKDWVLQQEATPGKISRIVDVSSAQVITFAEGETMLLVSDTWPGNQWWHPNIVMVADGQGHSVPALAWEWDVNGTTMTATTQSGYYFTVDIPDTPNGDNRYEIRVTALAAGTAVISIGA